jgi:hypothetical protein
MATILLLAVLLGSVVAIILMIYLIDRVKRLEILSLEASSRINQPEPPAENGFLGLSGKALWDAMSGKIPENFNQADLVALKPRFAFVLQNHIETLFKLGKKDASEGNGLGTPKNPIEISTLRGVISSWLPTQHATTIYKTGYQSIEADEVDISRLSADLDEVTVELYARVEIRNTPAFSQKLMAPAPAVVMPNAEMLEKSIDESGEEFSDEQITEKPPETL